MLYSIHMVAVPNQIVLSPNVLLRSVNIVPVKEGSEVWRIILAFISDYPSKNKLIKEYFVWVTGEYLEDYAKLSATIESAEKFAFVIAQKRFHDSGNEVPIENGISCSNNDGIVFVNPKYYLYPEELT